MVLIPWRKWKSKRLPSVSDLELCLVTAVRQNLSRKQFVIGHKSERQRFVVGQLQRF
ncbi:predicted protein [Arabidopsis lyrata subsp. lyrata]|uniref:Predicted protein n=1 Tax=Arabidopsis lyrata subsp. lyrata TaxID=81972 RepID=D7KU53_ARALL|nr:predicted protein [Arabidopsis lyrata subsp. lyrata]